MNSIIIPLFVLLLFFFHIYTGRCMRLGKLKEGLCAAWFMDMVFTICGIVAIFYFYHYFTSIISVYLVKTDLYLL